MSSVSALQIGLSGLLVDQRLMSLAGQNIANANTPGYHEQSAALAELATPGVQIGDGVQITRINRLIDNVIEASLNTTGSSSSSVSAQLGILQQAQDLLNPGTGSLNDLLQNFFNAAVQLSSQPGDPTQRQVYLSAASDLAGGLNTLANGLSALETNTTQQAQTALGTLNQLLPQIASLNDKIKQATLLGTQPNELSDQRDQLISQVANLVNVQTVEEDNGQTGLIIGGIPVVTGNQSTSLALGRPSQGFTLVQASGSTVPLNITGGQLAGLQSLSQQTLPGLTYQVNSLAQQLIQGIDEIQGTSVPLSGSFASLQGQRPVTSVTAPLSKAGLTFTPQAGTLYINVINNATGANTLTPVNINPASQSLQDVATAISTVPHLQAVVNSQTNTLTILAQPGYSFNFAGQLPSVPQTTNLSGTATAQLSGTYTGAKNDQYTFTVVGNGTVGVSQNLNLQVTDSSGAVLGTFNIGQGYTAGTALPTVNGVNVQLSAGTVNNGDSFATAVVANPDTSKLLSALGLNAFFQGDSAGSVQVRSDLLADPTKLALSKSGQTSDGSALAQLAGLQNQSLFANGTQSFQQFLAGVISGTGAQVQALTHQQSALETATQALQSQQQSISGVDQNQEMVKLLQYQQSYEMAAKYISNLDQSFSFLMQITV